MLWGAGHALGTLLLSLPLLLLAQLAQLSWLAAVSNRLAGLALLATAVYSWHSSRAARSAVSGEAQGPFWVGLAHGVTGAGALLLVLPNTLGTSLLRSSLFLCAFAVGSTLAMSVLTRALGRLGRALDERTLRRARRGLLLGAVALGSVWLALG